MKITELAELTGCSKMYINHVSAGLERITDDFVEDLKRVLGVKKSFWIILQKQYDMV